MNKDEKTVIEYILNYIKSERNEISIKLEELKSKKQNNEFEFKSEFYNSLFYLKGRKNALKGVELFIKHTKKYEEYKQFWIDGEKLPF